MRAASSWPMSGSCVVPHVNRCTHRVQVFQTRNEICVFHGYLSNLEDLLDTLTKSGRTRGFGNPAGQAPLHADKAHVAYLAAWMSSMPENLSMLTKYASSVLLASQQQKNFLANSSSHMSWARQAQHLQKPIVGLGRVVVCAEGNHLQSIDMCLTFCLQWTRGRRRMARWRRSCCCTCTAPPAPPTSSSCCPSSKCAPAACPA